MNKVVIINLNGRAYQIEEEGHDLLRNYLDQAAEKLGDNPDRTEIMADFEQAIADKCDARLSSRKNVVTRPEIEEIIRIMGPVDTGTAAHQSAKQSASDAASKGTKTNASTTKRLYRIHEGSLFRGVCAGIGAYFNVDATLVRAIFIVLTFLTGGGWILAYFIMMLVMPVARTGDQVAQAHGEPPFTAKDFIDGAKAEYSKFSSSSADVSKEQWKQQMRDWKKQMHENRHAWRDEWRAEWNAKRDNWDTSHRGSVGPVIGALLMSVLWLVFVIVVWSFLTRGMIFGQVVGAGHPIWVTLLFLVLIFWLVALPLRALSRNSHHHAGIWALIPLIGLFYVASLLFPSVHVIWQHVITYLQTKR